MSASTELISIESKEIQLYHDLCPLTLDLKPNREVPRSFPGYFNMAWEWGCGRPTNHTKPGGRPGSS